MSDSETDEDNEDDICDEKSNHHDYFNYQHEKQNSHIKLHAVSPFNKEKNQQPSPKVAEFLQKLVSRFILSDYAEMGLFI